MGVRKIISFFFLLSLWNFSWGQGDSTMLTLNISDTSSTENYFVENFDLIFSPLDTLENNQIIYQLNTNFQVKDSIEISILTIEISTYEEESEIVNIINRWVYEGENALVNYLDSSTEIYSIPLDNLIQGIEYKVHLQVTDLNGNMDRTLIKTILL